MLKVLVVEDEEMIRRGIVETVDWAALDCVVVGEAANGEAGLAAAEAYDPDLIITDLKMPKMDGLMMLRRLREGGSRCSVIILTAYSSFSYAQSALRLGAVDFLLKPFHDGDLEAAIARLRPKLDAERREMPGADLLPDLKKEIRSSYIPAAMAYIAARYNDPDISVTAIAWHLGISAGHLSHTFKSETGYTLLGYLTRYRIHRAMGLLRDCRIRVYEAADQVGYRDITHFSATFKKLTGMTPSEFQNLAAQNARFPGAAGDGGTPT